ncbi:MAG: glycosyl hydrolase [Planctomycetota bacterium]|nr:glycosyl hydrolase [Planctomycetota bacterium]
MKTTNQLIVLLALLLCLIVPSARAEAQDEEAEEVAVQKQESAEPDEESKGADQEAEGEEEETGEEEEDEEEVLTAGTFAGLKLRCLGPALTSGRIVDFAVEPGNRSHYYVAVASGGVWKTTNAGTTFTPIFDSQGSYSIGCIAMDPNNPAVIWVGTGENNSQRSVSFGDGVYRSRDGGAHWENMGLKESEHIGMIAIDPRDSETVYVAAQGPLWCSGGDRGLYKTTDGGTTWECVLHISDDTGVNEVHLDPRDPDIVYASSYQRRRHVWTLIHGGPESALYKSTNAGATWRKITHGLPGGDKGRIGLDISPADPDVLYAIIDARGDSGGFFRSTNRGESWQKRSGYRTTSAQYYNEIICDPEDVDRVYVLDTVLHVTDDGGRTFQRMPRRYRHVDDHALWIDPANADYILVGCDGGVYDTYDRGENWHFKPNLPVTQFYRVTVDNSTPFYYVYGGTQDNNTLAGPSRTTRREGITNEDWFVTVGGDGFKTQVDPEDPNIVYSQLQYGGLVRYDRRSGERVDIKPREAPDEDPYRWNWDAPLIISPHSHTRLYFAANRLFRSDDRGNTWRAISGDLTRQIDRNTLEVMGRIWPVDAVGKHDSTSYYGNIVALSESPLVEGLIYVGTDDGLVQVTEDGGETWRKIETFPDVPEMTYVSGLTASQHDADVVYATFDNHKKGDFEPYVLRSGDRGRTWESIVGDLAELQIAYIVAEDHVKPELLFLGTEFGVYFTPDGGGRWIRLKGGMPTIAVRDIAIHAGQTDLVLGTFGRGIYVLDDYTPLRLADEQWLERGPSVFPIRPALRYIERSRGRGSQGASFYRAPNPPFGAVFTYYIDEKPLTRRERRKKAEKEAIKAGETPPYPTIEELRAEEEERAPTILLLVRDESGALVRRLRGSRSEGIHRAVWDLRLPARTPVRPRRSGDGPSGPLALPGLYTVTLAKEVDGVVSELTEPQPFEVLPLELATFAAADRAQVLAFRKKVADLNRAVQGALRAAGEAQERIDHVRQAVLDTPDASLGLITEVNELDLRLEDILRELRGDRTKRTYREPTPSSIRSRVSRIVYGQWNVTSAPTQTQRDAYRQAGEAFTDVLDELRLLMEEDLVRIEEKLERVGAPWTPGRIPAWEMK